MIGLEKIEKDKSNSGRPWKRIVKLESVKILKEKMAASKKKIYTNKLMMTFHCEKMDWVSELKREELEVSKLDGGARER